MKLAALVEALSAIAKDHPEAEIVMSDGETAYNLRERPIAWSDLPHDGNGSVTLYYGGLADALGPRPMSRCTSWGPMRPPSGWRRLGRGPLRVRPFITGPGQTPPRHGKSSGRKRD